jgi:hypothetical protein
MEGGVECSGGWGKVKRWCCERIYLKVDAEFVMHDFKGEEGRKRNVD